MSVVSPCARSQSQRVWFAQHMRQRPCDDGFLVRCCAHSAVHLCVIQFVPQETRFILKKAHLSPVDLRCALLCSSCRWPVCVTPASTGSSLSRGTSRFALRPPPLFSFCKLRDFFTPAADAHPLSFTCRLCVNATGRRTCSPVTQDSHCASQGLRRTGMSCSGLASLRQEPVRWPGPSRLATQHAVGCAHDDTRRTGFFDARHPEQSPSLFCSEVAMRRAHAALCAAS